MNTKTKKAAANVVTLGLLMGLVSMSYAGWTCSADPTQCPNAQALKGQLCDGQGHKWSVEGPASMLWWGCQGTGSCPSASIPPGGGCTKMVTKWYNTYLVTCNGNTRSCSAGGSTGPGPDPNRTCDNQQCSSGDSIPIPTLIYDVCANGGNWPPIDGENYGTWFCTGGSD